MKTRAAAWTGLSPISNAISRIRRTSITGAAFGWFHDAEIRFRAPALRAVATYLFAADSSRPTGSLARSMAGDFDFSL
jgi:hypothetical protein